MRFVLASLALGALLFVGSARAEDAYVEGTVLGADSTDLVVDLGSSRGATDGAIVELWRPIRIKHPVTGQILTDRFLVGKLKLIQVRPNLALAQPSGVLTRVPQAGDVVRLPRATLTPFPSPSPTPTGKSPTPTPTGTAPPIMITPGPADADAMTLSALFDSLSGKQPTERAEAYENYARSHPRSRFVQVLLEEAAAFRAPSANAPSATAQAPAAKKRGTVEVRSFEPATRAFAGTPLHVALELMGHPQGAVLFVRAPETGTYEPIAMTGVGNGYFEATIPARSVVAPSARYFIEASGPDGAAVPIEGSAMGPLVIEVEDKPAPTAQVPVRAQFALWTDFAVWNAKKLNDYASQTEGLFGVRFGDTGVRALRTGFGVYRGVGGSLDELDTRNLEPRNVGLTYGYLETELAPAVQYSFVLRAVVGLGQGGVGGGLQGFVRIGNDQKTNLLLGGEVLSGVGIRGIAQLEWSATPRVPIMFRTEVTNQPAGISAGGLDLAGKSTAGGDIGVRLIVQGGYRITDHFTAALRASYQGRTINHAGPGGGAAVEYSW